MATILNADTVVGGAIVTGDASGELALQAAGVTKLTVASAGVTLATPLAVGSGGTGATSLSGITVGTATTATTATTSTNLAGGSNGTIPYQSAAGTTQMLAVGTSGQVLQTNGAGAPTWVTPSAGAMVLISTTTASSSSAVTFSSLSGYNNYRILISGLTLGGTLQLQFGQPSLITSGYNYSQIYLDSVAIQRSYNNTGSDIYLISSDISTNASRGVGGTIDVFDMTSLKYTRLISNMGYYFNTTPAWTFYQTWGIVDNNGSAVNVIKIYPTSGTFSGKISLYGITA
jgi:hypothetical protein